MRYVKMSILLSKSIVFSSFSLCFTATFCHSVHMEHRFENDGNKIHKLFTPSFLMRFLCSESHVADSDDPIIVGEQWGPLLTPSSSKIDYNADIR